MGLLKRASDTAYAFRFLRLLTQDWDKTQAYEMGLIDDNGALIRKPETGDEKSAFTYFHRLVFNIKRVMQRMPSMLRKVGSYAAALYLLKAHVECTEEQLVEALGIDIDELNESNQTPFDLKENCLYQLGNSVPLHTLQNQYVEAAAGTTIVIKKSLGIHFATELFEATHKLTGCPVIVSGHDISEDLMKEEVMTTADMPDIPKPLVHHTGAKYQHFKVPSDVFRRFDTGRNKHERWNNYLDLADDTQTQIRSFVKKYPKATAILQDEDTGAVRSIRRRAANGF